MTPGILPPSALEALDTALADFPRHAPMASIDLEVPTRLPLAAGRHFNAVLAMGRDTERPRW